jgi:DNA repair exonuclease SbcCD nuclease subunit
LKILHCSDIHLGRRIVGASGKFSDIRFDDYFQAFEFIIDYAIEFKIDVFVIAGDLFDKKELSPEVLSRSENLLQKLKNASIPCLVIEGNHDNITFGKENQSWINYLQIKSLIKRLSYSISESGEFDFTPLQIENVNFYGLGYPGAFVDELLTKFSENIQKIENNINYVIVHTGIKNNDIINGTVNSDSIDKLIGKADYIAGGHLHSHSKYPSENPIFYIPGSPEMWDLDEYRQRKGFIVYDTETNEKQFFPSKNREKFVLKLTLNSNNYEEVNQEILRELSEIELLNSPICYILLTLQNQVEIDIRTIEEYLIQKGAAKVVFKIENFSGKIIEFEGYNGTESDIENEVIGTWDKFSGVQSDTHKLLQNMKSFHNEKLEDDFHFTLDLFLDKMIGIA